MVVAADWAAQGLQMLMVLLVAPLLTGFVRWLKARLLRRRGSSPLQPYRDLLRLVRKEVVLAENASWLFRVAPYLVFTATIRKMLSENPGNFDPRKYLGPARDALIEEYVRKNREVFGSAGRV